MDLLIFKYFEFVMESLDTIKKIKNLEQTFESTTFYTFSVHDGEIKDSKYVL